MTYFYCPKPTPEARILAASLGAVLVRHFDGLHLWIKKAKVNLAYGDQVICWGASLPEMDGVKVLNALMHPFSEYDMFLDLRNKVGLHCPSVIDNTTPKDKAIKSNYFPRLNYHPGGDDLLVGVSGTPDYYMSLYRDLGEEVRVHIFNKRFIKFGTKVHREGFRALNEGEVWRPNAGIIHPTIKAWNGGWKIRYGEAKSSYIASYKSTAQSVMKGLGLTFGTVDMAYYRDAIVVLGVGIAPDLPEPSFLDAYIRWIGKWQRNELDEKAPQAVPGIVLDGGF